MKRLAVDDGMKLTTARKRRSNSGGRGQEAQLMRLHRANRFPIFVKRLIVLMQDEMDVLA
jgi:hypothetical protein